MAGAQRSILQAIGNTPLVVLRPVPPLWRRTGVPQSATVATIAVDSGLRYLSTDVYR
jgi:hypothetical protein